MNSHNKEMCVGHIIKMSDISSFENEGKKVRLFLSQNAKGDYTYSYCNNGLAIIRILYLERGSIMTNTENISVCKSIFKSGESKTSTSQFTKVWIELINNLEKNKGASVIW